MAARRASGISYNSADIIIGWFMKVDSPASSQMTRCFVFRDQVGEVIDSAGYSPPTDYDLAEWMRNKLEDLHIDAETCVPQWYAGDVMDYDLAVSSLFQCADPTLERATDKHMLI